MRSMRWLPLLLIPCLMGEARAATASPAIGVVAKAQKASTSAFDRTRYTPVIVRLSFTSTAAGDTASKAGMKGSFLDLTLIPLQGDLVGKRVEISTSEFAGLLRSLYADLARQAPLDVQNPQSASRRLYDLLIRPLLPDLKATGATTLLISADPGLQAVPFAALHDGSQFFGEAYAFSLTPSIALTPLDLPSDVAKQDLALGSSRFDGLAPLPLVPQELEQLGQIDNAQTYLDQQFTPEVLLSKVADPNVDRVHVATHAEFLPGGPDKARVYTGKGPVPLREFAGMRQRREGHQRLDLFILSACRTALGDKDSELGFAGLAIQAGSRSAVGTIWYVDDVATSAFFVEFYRQLKAGLPKAEAMQATRRAFASGAVHLQADRLVNAKGELLLKGLTPEQQRRVQAGLTHPYFWAGIQLLGTPW